MEDLFDGAPVRGARTVNVLLMLAVAATVFSYLGAYALSSALVKADLLDKWPPGYDPRPRWMLTGFISALAAFVVIGGSLRWSSNRQLKRMERMDDDS